MRLLPALLAVLGPLGVLAAMAVWLRTPPAAEDNEWTTSVRQQERTFKQVGDPDLVVVGNSKITTDLYLPSVASAFGLEPRRVVPLSIAGSGIAVWYAALERHVFRTGYQPDHILVYGPPVRLLEAEPRSVRERAKLEAELDGIPEAEANEIRMRAGVDPRWERAVANAEHLHDDLLDGWRDRILHAFLGMDAADVTPALESVFAVGSTGESHGALPVAAAEPVQYPLSEPEDSVLAALVERAHAEGIQVVVALAPVGSSLAATEADPVTPERLAALVRWLEANDVGWIDVRDTTSDADLGDGMHMTSVGRERFRVPFAAALAEQQQERGPVRPALPPRLDPPPDLRREGTPTPPQFEARDGKTPCTGAFNAAHFRAATPSLLPELPDLPSPFVLTVAGVPLPSASSLGDLTTGCIGKYFHHNGQLSFSRPSEDAPLPEVAWRMEPPTHDAGWVYPGTALVVDVPGPVDRVSAEVREIGGDGGTLTAGTRTVPLDAESVTVALDEDGDIAVRLASPPDGPLLLVERLVAETNGERWYLVGSPPRARGGSLLSRVVSATPVPALPPLTLPEPVQSTVRPDMFVVKAPTLDIPNDDVVYLRTGALCSPIAADRDGVPAATLKRPSGATWYFVTVSRKEVHIRAAEGAPPVVGATWTFGLDPARTCRRGGVWVYGGDRLDVTPRNRGGLPIGANRLDLAGAAFGAIGETRVTLRMGDAVLAAVTVPPNGWDGAGIQVPLTTPVDAWTELPTLHVEMDGSGYLLLTTADVIAPADEPGAR